MNQISQQKTTKEKFVLGLLVFCQVFAGTSGELQIGSSNVDEPITMIDTVNSDSRVIAQLGTTGFLKCSVINLRDEEVSWVRRRDFHILTSGRQVFTPDNRISVRHSDDLNDWILTISFMQKRDEGPYVCQVPTERGLLKHEINLTLTESEAFILGGRDFHVEKGTTISLVCIVEKSLIPPEYVFWYHNERLLNFGSQRGGITVETEVSDTRTHSKLKVRLATESDSGNYTCKAANSQPASIYVHISGGDTAAAISGKNAASYPSCKYHAVLLLLLLLVSRFKRTPIS
ncbi:zwei Ig domain protein zig-8-like [Artemia franciscana]|uniref:Ig-like domain-containing protein n=1 Tax=Artemia franciscana TaxID=6661 RepID=A0AA88I9X3_ARTSF|nr:hypothetical protein QYM36_003008 [Artemia franciscana]